MRKTDKLNDFRVLSKLVVEKCRYNVKNETWVAHLRLGDIFDGKRYKAMPHLVKEYKKPPYHYTSQIPPFSKVTIVGGSHVKLKNYTKSLAYVQQVKKALESQGCDVNLRIGTNPDEDFIFMVGAHKFVSSGGGYSRLIENVRKELGKSGDT